MSSIKEVAERAGVSVAAASSVLGAAPCNIRVSHETRGRILDAAQRLSYRRNPLAVSFRTGRTRNIGLLMMHPALFLTHPNGALSFAAIVGVATAADYRVTVIGFQPKLNLDWRLMDGCVLMGMLPEPALKDVARLAERVPVLSPHEGVPGTVRVHEYQSTQLAGRRLAAEYLYDLGHRHVAVVGISGGRRPERHFEDVARERGWDVKIESFTDHWQERVYPTVEQICALDPLPTAVFAFDDDYARTLIARLGRIGRRVPEDVSVFSGQTHRVGYQTAPALTGLDMHMEQAEAQVFRQFIEYVKKRSTAMEIVVTPPPVDLVVRESCSPARPPQGV